MQSPRPYPCAQSAANCRHCCCLLPQPHPTLHLLHDKVFITDLPTDIGGNGCQQIEVSLLTLHEQDVNVVT